jgi:hypothetical protein
MLERRSPAPSGATTSRPPHATGARTPALIVAVIAGAVAEYTVDWRWARRKH